PRPGMAIPYHPLRPAAIRWWISIEVHKVKQRIRKLRRRRKITTSLECYRAEKGFYPSIITALRFLAFHHIDVQRWAYLLPSNRLSFGWHDDQTGKSTGGVSALHRLTCFSYCSWLMSSSICLACTISSFAYSLLRSLHRTIPFKAMHSHCPFVIPN